MGKLLNLISKFQKLDVTITAANAMKDVTPELAEKQKEQLTEGESASGDRLHPYRNKSYAMLKNQLNPLPGLGNPDLKLFGHFHAGISARVDGGKVVVQSSDDKAAKLEQQYGKDEIFGLNKEHKGEFVRETYRPAFNRAIKKYIRL